jgi:hypothetical protein
MNFKIYKIAFVLFCFNCCCAANMKKTDPTKTNNNYLQQSQSPILFCCLDGFTKSQSENIIVEIKEPFVVRNVKGRIKNTENDYGWSKDFGVLIEIRKRNSKSEINHVFADEKGLFEIKEISVGEYCFKATINGWQSVVGIIIVTNEADPKNEIVFQMPLGV